MVNIDTYMTQLIDLLKHQFKSRLLYVGLQGSYLRGEASSSSDLDIMVIIDGLTISDLNAYRTVIRSLDHSDKSCGFICSKTDLAHWNPMEIHHLLHSTKDYYGQLQNYVPSYTDLDVRNFVKISVNNLYHELCHRCIHGQLQHTQAALPGLYKSVFFILQNLHSLNHGTFPATKQALLRQLGGKNHAVLQRSIDLNKGAAFDFDECFELLFTWCQETLHSL